MGKFKLSEFRSGGFANKKPDMARVYIELPIIEAKKLLKKLNRPAQCFEGGDPKTCECPDHGRSLVDALYASNHGRSSAQWKRCALLSVR
jgi:hypothetical protein